MTDKKIETNIQNMIGMKFGSYNASVNSMNKAYEKDKCGSDSYHGFSTDYSSFFKDGEYVATARIDKDSDGKIDYSIWDATTQRQYYTGWHDNAKNDDFKYVEFQGYSVEDTNGNGIVDSSDLIRNYDHAKGITVEDFLNHKPME